jgi:hypothetical protein
LGGGHLDVGVGVVLVAEDVEAPTDSLNHGLEPIVDAHVAVFHLLRAAVRVRAGGDCEQRGLSPLPGRSELGSRFSESRTR